MTAVKDRYALSNELTGTARMLDCLSGVLDVGTRDLLEPFVRPGGRYLELGAGNGSVAAWLADAAGPDGRVVATDLQPDHIRADVLANPRIDVVQHDLRRIIGLPTGSFALIHARLLFAHLADREQILPRVAGLLEPGGWLAIEDWGGAGTPAEVLYSPFPETAELYRHYQRALMEVFASVGNDPRWCGRTHAAMTNAGLVDVHTTVRSRSWRGGEAGAALPIAVSAVVREGLIARGLHAASLDLLREHLADPRVVLLGNPTWQTVGRRPETG